MPREYKTPIVTIANLWEKQRPDGTRYFTGKLGAARIVVQSVPNAAIGEAGWVLRLAETSRTIQPVCEDVR